MNHFYLILFIVIVTAKFRVEKVIPLPNTPSQMILLDRDLLAITYQNRIQILTGQNFTQVKEQKEIGVSQNIQIKNFNGSLVYIDQGKVNLIKSDSAEKYYQAQIGSILGNRAFLEMKTLGEEEIIAPMQIYNKILKINTKTFNVKEVIGEPQQFLTKMASNLVTYENGTYFYAKIDRKDYLYYLNLFKVQQDKIQNVLTFQISIINEIISSQIFLDIIEQNGQTYFCFSIKTSGSNNIYSFIKYRLEKDQNSLNKEIYVLQQNNTISKVQTVKAIDSKTLIYYTQNYINQIYPLNRSQSIKGFSSGMIVNSFSKDGKYMFGMSKNFKLNNFYAYGYLSKYNQTTKQYNIIKTLQTSQTGYGYYTGQFIGNNEYLVVQQLFNNSIYDYQLSLFDMSTLSFVNTSLYQKNANYRYFCSNKNSNGFFVYVQNTKKSLRYYQVQNDSFILIDSYEIVLISSSNQPQIKCIGNDEVIFGQKSFLGKEYIFKRFKLNLEQKIQLVVQKVLAISQSVSLWVLSAVFNDYFVLYKPYSKLSYFCFDYDFNTLDIKLQQVSNLYTQIVSYSQNYLLLKDKYDNVSHLYKFQKQKFIHSGVYSLLDNNRGSIRYMLIQQLNSIYVEFDFPNRAFYYDIEKPAIKIRGLTYDPKTGQEITLTKTIFYIKNNKTYLIGIHDASKRMLKYDVTREIKFIQSYSIQNIKNVYKIRISSDKLSIIIIQLNKPAIVEIVEQNNFDNLKYRRSFQNMSINDLDYTAEQNVIMFYLKSPVLKIYFYQNPLKQIQTQKIFKQINVLAIQQKLMAYSGIQIQAQNQKQIQKQNQTQIQTQIQSKYFIYHSITSQQQILKVVVDCQINYLQFSSNQKTISGKCNNNNYFNYLIQQNKTKKTSVEGNLKKISYINDTHLLISQDQKIYFINIFSDINQNSIKKTIQNQNKQASLNIIAIDKINKLVATSSTSPQLSEITIFDFQTNIIDEIQLPNVLISSLLFSEEGNLYIATNDSRLYIWTSQPCPQNQTIINLICQCKETFKQINNTCICPNNLIIQNQQCGCPDTFIQEDQTCVCPNNLIVKDNLCTCPDTFILVDQTCVCPNNLVVKDTLCTCNEPFIEKDNKCQCPKTFIEKDNDCVCPNNLIIIGDICGCQRTFILQNNQCKCPQQSVQNNDTCICNDPFIMNGNKCECPKDYVKKQNQCECQYNLIQGKCECPQNTFYGINACIQCSAFCSSCLQEGISGCSSYSAAFYILVIGLSVLFLGISVFIIIKIKSMKRKKDQLLQNQEESQGKRQNLFDS